MRMNGGSCGISGIGPSTGHHMKTPKTSSATCKAEMGKIVLQHQVEDPRSMDQPEHAVE